MIIYSDSRVHGNRTLYAEAISYYYKLLLLNCWFQFLFLAGKSRRGSRRHLLLLIITTYYYTMLQQLLLHCYYIHAIELLAILILCFKTRVKMLVFDRPSFSSLF